MSEVPIGPEANHDGDFLVAIEGGRPLRSVVRLRGDIDLAVAPRLSKCLVDLAAVGDVVVDMADMRFIDSTGMGALVMARKAVHAHGGEISLRNLAPNVAKTMALAGLDKVFAIDG